MAALALLVVGCVDKDDIATLDDAGQDGPALGDGGAGTDSGDVDSSASMQGPGDGMGDGGPLDEDAGTPRDTDAGGTHCTMADECLGMIDPNACERVACEDGLCIVLQADDDQACTPEDSCILSASCQAGICTADTTLADGLDCDDGLECTSGDSCQQGRCLGQSTCEKNSCQASASCDALLGVCVYENVSDGQGCDDDESCTQDDYCRVGECIAGTTLSDDAPCDDGNACTPTDSCDAGVCQGQGRVECKSPGVCEANSGTCNDETGLCEYEAYSGLACTDGCIQGVCVEGTCEGGLACIQATVAECNADGMTLEISQPVGVCASAGDACEYDLHTIDCSVGCANGACIVEALNCAEGDGCDDENPCTHTDTCSADNICVGTPVVCVETNADDCSVDVCNPGTGACEATLLEDGSSCSDGDSCSIGDICDAGSCVAGAALADDFEPNDTMAEASHLRNIGSCFSTNYRYVRSVVGASDSGDPEDWYKFYLTDAALCAPRPTATIQNLAGEGEFEVCAYYECTNQTGGTPTMACDKGVADTDGASGLLGCCATADDVDTSATVRLKPNCPGGDSGTVHIRVTSDADLGCGYELNWEDSNGS